MANINENRLNTVIADLNVTAIGAGFTDINNALDGSTQSLTEDERKALFSLDVANKEFVNDCLALGVSLNLLLPTALQTIVTNLQNDVTLNAQCETIENIQLSALALRVSDTRRLSGHEAYVGALALYKIIEAMAIMGVEGFQAAYDVLKKRFENQGGSKPPQTGP